MLEQVLVSEMANCALLEQRIEWARLRVQRRYWPENLDRMVGPPGEAVASVRILAADRRYAYAVDNSEGPQLCHELLVEAARADPTRRV